MKKTMGIFVAIMLIATSLVMAYEPTQDTKVSYAQPRNNFGSGVYSMVGDKSTGTDRYWLEFDISNSGRVVTASAKLNLWVYWTSANIKDKEIQAWYCNGVSFNDNTLTWNTQPVGWNKQTGAKLTGNNCVLASTFKPTQRVVGAYPYPAVYGINGVAQYADQHIWDLTSVVNQELKSDGKFTIVLKYATENVGSLSRHWAQYITQNYAEAAYRPSLIIN